MARSFRSVASCCFGLLAGVGTAASAQTPVEGVMAAGGAVQRAQAWMQLGQRDSATELLGRHLSRQPNDGRAWFYLGSIYLAEAQGWHRTGHPAGVSSASLLDFASTSFEPAQDLLTDSGGVFRVVVAVERATLRIENAGWDSIAMQKLSADEVPLPPVLVELGRNLLASCSGHGVLLTTALTETVAAWGLRLQGERSDLVLVRADMYQWDPRYRARMAATLGVDSAADLPAALAVVAAMRPVCLAPSVEAISGGALPWRAERMVLTTAPPNTGFVPALSVFHFARTGLAGSVWTASARDIYDLAARRNRALCTTLFATTDVLNPPAIPACSR
ncbi:MAG: hypothetical protein ACRELE_03925 [Gemmatimonadales bacterium]